MGLLAVSSAYEKCIRPSPESCGGVMESCWPLDNKDGGLENVVPVTMRSNGPDF
jgi:hypothetical protein